MHFNVLAAVLGTLSLLTAAVMLPALLFSLMEEAASSPSFCLSVAISLITAAELKRYGPLDKEQLKEQLSVREGIAITTLGWLLCAALWMIPYFAGGYLGLLDSFTEALSGLSGTGATVLADVEVLPKSVLFWRSLSNWFGGLGIIVIFMAILPQFGRGAIFMMRAESTGPTGERQLPRVRENAQALFLVYILITTAAAIVYMLCGLDWFTAVNHAATTIATGGFSTFNDGVMHFQNIYLEGAMTIFMLIASANFGMYVLAIRKGYQVIFKSSELRAYLFITFVSALLITVDLIAERDMSFLSAFRYASFQAASLSSTTGFVSYDFDLWPPFSKAILLLLMFLGGCAASTAGGLKITRFLILLKSAEALIWQKLHPQMIAHVKMDGRIVPPDIILSVGRYFFVYVMIDLALAFFFILDGFPLVEAVSVSVSTMGSIGPGFGFAGATSTYSVLGPLSKIAVCVAMFLSRLEIFTVFACVSPEFWSRRGW